MAGRRLRQREAISAGRVRKMISRRASGEKGTMRDGLWGGGGSRRVSRASRGKGTVTYER